jgi:very-short-patch-repair endonuclease
MSEYLHRADLRRAGFSRAAIATAVATGELIRARRDHYVRAGTPEAVVRAVRVGGRVTCLSLLALLGVFVLQNTRLHVHLVPTASRMRSPHDRWRPLDRSPDRDVRLHWLPLSAHPGQSAIVGLIDALAHAVLCQTPRAAIATLDSALYARLIREDQLDDVFRLLPVKYAILRAWIDARAESGYETLLRLMLRASGFHVDVQVVVPGVGRVDLVVNGWLVVECDSRAFHEGWPAQARDRERDLALAARGFTTIRPTAGMIEHRPELVLAAVRGLIAARQYI